MCSGVPLGIMIRASDVAGNMPSCIGLGGSSSPEHDVNDWSAEITGFEGMMCPERDVSGCSSVESGVCNAGHVRLGIDCSTGSVVVGLLAAVPDHDRDGNSALCCSGVEIMCPSIDISGEHVWTTEEHVDGGGVWALTAPGDGFSV